MGRSSKCFKCSSWGHFCPCPQLKPQQLQINFLRPFMTKMPFKRLCIWGTPLGSFEEQEKRKTKTENKNWNIIIDDMGRIIVYAGWIIIHSGWIMDHRGWSMDHRGCQLWNTTLAHRKTVTSWSKGAAGSETPRGRTEIGGPRSRLFSRVRSGGWVYINVE